MRVLRDYLFIDERRLNSFVEQIGGRKPLKRSKRVGLSLTGPSVELAQEETEKGLSTHEKIETLIAYLEKERLLERERPQDMSSPGKGRFVLETMTARKMIIPQVHLQAAPGIRHLAVWISEPDSSQFVDQEYIWRGTFLYLTELWLDEGVYGTVYSGCSALQAIANAVAGRNLLDRSDSQVRREPLGRGNFGHPIEKLRPLEVIPGDERRITSLYKPRYLTNEQCYLWEGQKRRVNDLLGYPIFIAAD